MDSRSGSGEQLTGRPSREAIDETLAGLRPGSLARAVAEQQRRGGESGHGLAGLRADVDRLAAGSAGGVFRCDRLVTARPVLPPGWPDQRGRDADRRLGPNRLEEMRTLDAVRLYLWRLGGRPALDQFELLLTRAETLSESGWADLLAYLNRPATRSEKLAEAWREFRSLLVEHGTGPLDAVAGRLASALGRVACWGRGPFCPDCRGRSNWASRWRR